MSVRVVPSLWLDVEPSAPLALWREAFGPIEILETQRYPERGLPEFLESMAGRILTLDIDVRGEVINLINGGPHYRPTDAISFMLNYDPASAGSAETAERELRSAWEVLARDGEVLMPLDSYPFSPLYGWVRDAFGVSWQLILTDPAGDPRPPLIPSLLFGGPAQDHAREALDRYVDVFQGVDSPAGPSRLGQRVMSPENPDRVMFSDALLAGSWWVAMDSAVPQERGFTPGVSLGVRCSDQAEIDHVWNALSANPDAEVCGWLEDSWGVSWQVGPANIATLLETDGAYAAMTSMKKIVIADLENPSPRPAGL